MEKAEITHSMEDYLESILRLQLKNGSARVKDIAHMMDVKMSSVNNAVIMLKKRNLVVQEPYGAIQTTTEGQELASKIFHRHKTLTKLFLLLGVPQNVAEFDACCTEHVISEATFKALEKYYNENSNK